MRPRHFASIALLSSLTYGFHTAPARAQTSSNSSPQAAQQSDSQSGWQKFSKPGAETSSQIAPNSQLPLNAKSLMNRINDERVSRGFSRLEWNDHLAESALTHGRRLVEQGRLSHQLPGEPDLSERIHATGLRFDSAGENLAVAGSVDEIHSALMNSPPHRANILDQVYNSVGIAIISRGRDLYAVENFARTYPSYSEADFRADLISTFNQARKAYKISPMEIHPDSRLQDAACSGATDTQAVLHNQPGARALVIFTASSPDMMPQDMLDAAADPNFYRMNLGVCFRPGKVQGNAGFRIVAAFYPGLHN